MTSSIAGLPAMLLVKARRWDPPDAAVWPDLVIDTPPDGDLGPCLVQAMEQVIVQALVAELTAEALDVAVLHGPSRLDQEEVAPENRSA